MAGEKVTGITIFVVDEGVDTGPILLKEELRIERTDTKGDLVPRLAELGAKLFVEAGTRFQRGEIEAIPQPSEGATYAEKIRKDELWIEWNRPASLIASRINALSPRPGARTYVDGALIKLLRARIEDQDVADPGEIVVREKRMFVGTSVKSVEILELQPEGKRTMPTSAYLSGHLPKKAGRFTD
jgi:methionyl-tRNA formyltransferase